VHREDLAMSDFDVKEENFVSGKDEDRPSQHRT
jgi:hypothetical protein